MMKKYLFPIMLSIVFLVSPTTYADTISTPSYQVDVTQPAAGIGLSKIAASDSVESDSMLRSFTQINSDYASIKKAPQKPKIILIGQCVSCPSNGVNGVSGGDSIGIRPIS